MKLEAETVLPVVVHSGGGHVGLLLQFAMVHRYRLRLVIDAEQLHKQISLTGALEIGTLSPLETFCCRVE